MAQVTIHHKNGQVNNPNMSPYDAIQLLVEFKDGKLPEIAEVTVKLP